MSGSTAGRIAAQRRAGGPAAATGQRSEPGSTIGRLLAAQEAGDGRSDTAPGAEPAKPRQRRKASTAERYAKHLRAQHPGDGFNDPGSPPRTGRTAGERHAARLRGEGDGDSAA